MKVAQLRFYGDGDSRNYPNTAEIYPEPKLPENPTAEDIENYEAKLDLHYQSLLRVLSEENLTNQHPLIADKKLYKSNFIFDRYKNIVQLNIYTPSTVMTMHREDKELEIAIVGNYNLEIADNQNGYVSDVFNTEITLLSFQKDTTFYPLIIDIVYEGEKSKNEENI